MQKNWMNEETAGYFRWHQNEQSGHLTEMCNLGKNRLGKNPALRF
jgi:hypothetical protein